MFKRTRKKTSEVQNLVAHKIAFAIFRVQVAFSQFFNAKSRHWKPKQQKWFLVCFVVGTQLISFGILVRNLRTQTPSVIEMPTPLPRLPTPGGNAGFTPRMTAKDYQILHDFKRRIDGMMTTVAGRDSIARFNKLRPGFIDSVLTVEKQLSIFESK